MASISDSLDGSFAKIDFMLSHWLMISASRLALCRDTTRWKADFVV